MTLVSILSLTEMRFIKEVLRDKRFLDVPQTYYDVNFYVHIGMLNYFSCLCVVPKTSKQGFLSFCK
jgi:hypothetical protein